MKASIRIGGAAGFWGDSAVGAPQLVTAGEIDYLVFDYLAETTMAILAASRRKNPELGYASDFVETVLAQVLPAVLARGIKVVSNAGGINPRACAAAVQALAASLGLNPRIAVIEGDDIGALMPALRAEGIRDMFSGEPLPAQVLSANAYLGAFPIARALAEGADIVITGRGVDSAVTLGPLIHEFGWRESDYDLLAAGSLAGHIIECGCQATGGLFTDWERVPDWAHIGYPIVECRPDGRFVVTKPPGTGGLIDRANVIEQMLYEIGDPGAYRLADVSCDFRAVEVVQIDADQVAVSGARGHPPGDQYKVSATRLDGYRCAGQLFIVGIDAAAKAQRSGEAILQRTREMIVGAGLGDFTRTAIERFGCESLYGAGARTTASREVMLRVVVDHPRREALECFAREIAPAGTSWAPGTTGPALARPPVTPLIKPFAFLIDKARVPATLTMVDGAGEREAGAGARFDTPSPRPMPRPPTSPDRTPPPAWRDDSAEAHLTLPLIRLAWARSGDKGNIANIGVIARRPEWLPLLWARLTPDAVAAAFAHLRPSRLERFHLPGTDALNLVLHDALDGGGPASTRFDPLGKGNAQILLDLPIAVPAALFASLQADGSAQAADPPGSFSR